MVSYENLKRWGQREKSHYTGMFLRTITTISSYSAEFTWQFAFSIILKHVINDFRFAIFVCLSCLFLHGNKITCFIT